MCLLSNNVNDYYFVAQGKTSIPGVDDGEELTLTDVSGWDLSSPAICKTWLTGFRFGHVFW